MTALFYAHDLLNLWLCRKHEILRRSASKDEHARGAARFFGIIDDRGALVDVAIDVQELWSRSDIAATFIPIELSPGELVNMGTAQR